MLRMSVVSVVLGILCLSMSVAAGASVEIGDKAPNFNVTGVDGKEYSLEQLEKAHDLVVVCFTCNQCPVAVAYEDRFIEFNKKFQGKNIAFVAVNANNRTETLDMMKRRAEEKDFNFTYAFDASGEAAKKYGARVTPELFVVKDGKIAYHGAYDDSQRSPQKSFLVDAVTALLAGSTPEVAKTRPFGCGIKLK